MALVDTKSLAQAVDRSLFGPQGRRWLERKLPGAATNMAFISVSTFGACVLVYHVSTSPSIQNGLCEHVWSSMYTKDRLQTLQWDLVASFGSAPSTPDVDHPLRCVPCTVLRCFRTSHSERWNLVAAFGPALSFDADHLARYVLCTVLRWLRCLPQLSVLHFLVLT